MSQAHTQSLRNATKRRHEEIQRVWASGLSCALRHTSSKVKSHDKTLAHNKASIQRVLRYVGERHDTTPRWRRDDADTYHYNVMINQRGESVILPSLRVHYTHDAEKPCQHMIKLRFKAYNEQGKKHHDKTLAHNEASIQRGSEICGWKAWHNAEMMLTHIITPSW